MPALDVDRPESPFQMKNHSDWPALPLLARGREERDLCDQANSKAPGRGQMNGPILHTHTGFDVQDINQRLIIPFDFIHQPQGYY